MRTRASLCSRSHVAALFSIFLAAKFGCKLFGSKRMGCLTGCGKMDSAT
jgi:hypothetical protein